MKNNIKTQKGITLIALVITIVVMLILAGISINLIIGENGIFTKTKEAREKYEIASVKEKLEVDSMSTTELNEAITDMTIEEYINDLKLKGLEVEKIKERFTINQKKEYAVVLDGKVYAIYAGKNGVYVKLENNHNILCSDNDAFSANDKFLSTGLYRMDINSISFSREKRHLEEGVTGYSDVTAIGHPAESVMAWWRETALGSGKYDVTIGAEGGVIAPIISRGLFYNMGITRIDFENLDVSQTVDFSYFVSNNSMLTRVDFGSNFDTSNGFTMGYMFFRDMLLEELNLGSKFYTGNVFDMGRMFQNCRSLTSLNLGSNFDTSNVVSFYNMFCGLDDITELNLMEKFSTKSSYNFTGMFAFQGGKEVKLYLGIFGEEMNNAEKTYTNMFYGFGTTNSRIYTRNNNVKVWLRDTVGVSDEKIVVGDY